MGGFLAALGGFGQGTADYSRQMRDLHQQTKMEMMRQTVDLLKSLPPDSTEVTEGIKHLNALAGAVPGKDNTGLFQKVHEWIHPHPNNVKGLEQLHGVEDAGPKTLPPGPAMPGNAPGTIQPISQPGQMQAQGQAQAQAQTQPQADSGNGFLQNLMKGGTIVGGAAQVSSNPIEGPKPIQTPTATAAPVTPATTAVSTPAAASSIPPVAMGGQPDIMSHLPENLRQYLGSNSYHRQQQIEQALAPYRQNDAELSRMQSLRQMDLGERQSALKELEASPEWTSLPDMMKSQYRLWAHSQAAQIPAMASGLMIPHVIAPSASGAGLAEGLDQSGQPIDRSGATDYRIETLPGSMIPVYVKLPHKTISTQTADGGVQLTNRNIIGPVAGAVAPGQNSIHTAPTTGGGVEVFTPHDLRTGVAPQTVAGAVAPSMLPNVSTTQTPGQLPTTTVRTKGGAGTSASASASGKPSSTPVVLPNDPNGVPGVKEQPDSRILGDVKDILNGEQTINTIPQKNRGLVQQYLNRNNLSKPVVVSPATQKTLSTIDPVISQMNTLTERLKGLTGKNLMPDFLKYSAGFHTPYDDLFTGVAFERLRSGSAVLQGMNSRALPIINKGLEHTPNFDRLHGFNPDSVALMLNKLETAKKILQEERAAAITDGHKSGVIQPIGSGVGSGAGTGDQVQTWVRDSSGKLVRQ